MRRRRPAELLAALRDGSPEDARVARVLARQRAGHHPELRKALAEHYRSLKEPAQAARWGIVLPGWATPREVARLRVWLAGEARRGDYIRDALLLRATEPIPDAVADLTDPSFRRRRLGARRARMTRWVGAAGAYTAIGGCACVAVSTGGMLWLGLLGRAAIAGASGVASLMGLTIYLVITGIGLGLFFIGYGRRDPEPAAPAFVDRRAIELLQERPEEGRAMLRALVWNDTTGATRRALVEDARRRGRPDEAGRWGCTVAGLSTSDEQAAYVDRLRRKGHPSSRRERLFDASHVPYSELTGGDVPVVLRMLGEPLPNPSDVARHGPGPRLRWWLLPLIVLPISAIATTAPWVDPRSTAATGIWLVLAVWAALSAISAIRRSGAARRGYGIAAAVFVVATAGFILVGRV